MLQITSRFPHIQSCPYTHWGQAHPLLVSSEVQEPGQQVCFSLQLVRKRPGQVLMMANTPGHQVSRLFFVTDRSSGLRFLVDTGAKVSVLPVSRLPHSSFPTGPTLQAVNHSAIATFGSASRTINLGLWRTFRWVFLIADVKHPILGADFLHHFNLLVDMTNGRLVDSVTHLQANGVLNQGSLP